MSTNVRAFEISPTRQEATVNDWPEHLVHENSNRGFARLPPVPSAYGGDVSVYESSAVEPHVWLKVQCPSNLNDKDSEPVEAVAHLTLEDALKIAQQLHWMVLRHHSKNEDWERALDHYFPLRWSTGIDASRGQEANDD